MKVVVDEFKRQTFCLADLLTSEGARIARRTVAKYREELGLPPASGRR